jgi:hypothetical protein
MSERVKDIIWFGTTVPCTLILMHYNPLAGFMFIIGLMLGSLVHTYIWPENKITMSEKEIKQLSEEISFRLLATRKHPEHDWLITKLYKTFNLCESNQNKEDE